jgi:nucleotide-binding universal stress UspA family protein
MYDTILLPTDGSEEMEPIIDHAVALAEVHDATLQALYVTNTASLSDLPMESTWEGLEQALQEEGQAGLRAVEERAETVHVETALLEGSPSVEIVEYAAEESCDIIVMGTHGRSGVNRLLLGSVAERVVRRSSVPVLTIHVDDASLSSA